MPGSNSSRILKYLLFITWTIVASLILVYSIAEAFINYLLGFEYWRIPTYFTGLEYTVGLASLVLYLTFPLYTAVTDNIPLVDGLKRVLRNFPIIYLPMIIVSLTGLLVSSLSIRFIIRWEQAFFVAGVVLSPVLGALEIFYLFLQPSISIYIARYSDRLGLEAYRRFWKWIKRTWLRSILASILGLLLAGIFLTPVFIVTNLYPWLLNKVASYYAHDFQIKEVLDIYAPSYLDIIAAPIWIISYCFFATRFFKYRNEKP
ncbi:hypothetical protein ACSU1N_01860 [Thermogladius sp. 4427co]|uniref:hypothetical protein n=1 Tax=Thermogladius sp. 4427co TaxID=3450718 RepID=UPI003F79E157